MLLWVAAVVGDVAASSIRFDDCFLFVKTNSLMSSRRDSEDNFQYYFSTRFVPRRALLSDEYLCSKQL